MAKKNQHTREIDIHGLTVKEAKYALERMLSSLNGNVRELKVIHGYSSTKLLSMVRNDLKHKRIKHKILTLNPGETILILS